MRFRSSKHPHGHAKPSPHHFPAPNPAAAHPVSSEKRGDVAVPSPHPPDSANSPQNGVTAAPLLRAPHSACAPTPDLQGCTRVWRRGGTDLSRYLSGAFRRVFWPQQSRGLGPEPAPEGTPPPGKPAAVRCGGRTGPGSELRVETWVPARASRPGDAAPRRNRHFTCRQEKNKSPRGPEVSGAALKTPRSAAQIEQRD